VLRRYGRQITRRPSISLPALVLPGIGDVLIFYAPPLVVARLLGEVARDDIRTLGMFVPYVLTFTALWFAGEVVSRAAEALIARSEIRGIEALYVETMDELLAKDPAFFHDKARGSARSGSNRSAGPRARQRRLERHSSTGRKRTVHRA
jgi:ATP-binding cassette subfamily B protein